MKEEEGERARNREREKGRERETFEIKNKAYILQNSVYCV